MRALGILVAAFALALALYAANLRPDLLYVDEEPHLRTILRFSRGDFRVADHLPMWPGYHLALGGLVRALGLQDPLAALRLARTVSVALSCAALVLFFRAAREVEPGSALARTALLAVHPVTFPYAALAFTDTASLCATLGAVGATLRRRYTVAGLWTLLAIAMRQSNLAWLVFMLGLAFLQEREQSLRWLASRCWLWLLTLVAVAGVAVAKGGLIFNPEHLRYCPSGLYSGNVIYQGAVFAVLLLPWLSGRTLAPLARPAGLVTLVVGFGLYLATFRPDNYFNQFPGYVDNTVLKWASSGLGPKLGFFLPVALGWLLVGTLLYHRGVKGLLLAIAILSVVPIATIGARYSMTAAVLVLLFARLETSRMRWAGIFYAGLTFWRLAGLLSGRMFP